jgi:hypothetical protein
MLDSSGIDGNLKLFLRAEYAQTATNLMNILSRNGGKSSYELFYKKEAKYSKSLQIFREIGIKISQSNNHQETMKDKGNLCVFLGLESNHPKDAYRVLDSKTKSIMITRDVRWLHKNYGEYYGTISPKTKQYTDLESSSDEEIQIINNVKNKEEKLEPKRKEIPKSSIITQSKALFDVLKDEESVSSQSSNDDMGFITGEIKNTDPYTFEGAYFDKEIKRKKEWRDAKATK